MHGKLVYLRNNPHLLTIPTGEKDAPADNWERMVDIANGDNDVIHWENMFSCVRDNTQTSGPYRTARGYNSPRCCYYFNADAKSVSLGFRPALVPLNPNTMQPDVSMLGALKNSDIVAMGTMLMGGMPVKIPSDPVDSGDIMKYKLGADITIEDEIPGDDAYTVVWIVVDGVLVANCNLLHDISYTDLERLDIT